MDMKLIIKAIHFAAMSHAGQVRKYSGIPYITHPLDVMYMLMTFGVQNPIMLAAAALHDVVEDTKSTLEDIREEFGDQVAMLVSDLTNTSKLIEGTNRAQRKQLDIERFKNAGEMATFIKMCDIICNVSDISREDKKFAKVYIDEKIEFVENAMQKLKTFERGWYYNHLMRFLEDKKMEVYLEK